MYQGKIKFIRFIMSRGKEMVVDEFQAREILASPQQLIPLNTMAGEWTGETINKAHIVCTERDREAEKEFEGKKLMIEQRKKYLEELKDIPPEKRAEYEEAVKRNRQEFETIVKYLTSKMTLKA